ncbi:peptidylprolyl isomerase [Hyphococcus sp.]|uniref:peptidylprolyl isomerase n=1 Tax=Hyphococcus sp. TaxID=2038636 RepID=UPI003CCC413B
MKVFVMAMLLLAAACAKKDESATRVVMETDAGAVTLELYTDKAPATAANFLNYVDEGAFDGSHIYRATREDNDPSIAIVQGGLWRAWEDGLDADYTPPLPPVVHETTEATGISHTDGVISMARVEPGSASSEWFINVGDNPSLDYGGARNPDGQGFAAFGKVVDGMDVIRNINAAPTREGDDFAGQILAEPIEIKSVKRVQ